MCTIAQTRSVPRPSFPNLRLRGSQRLIPASLPLCHSERVQRAPELLARPRDHLCYAVQSTQPLSILPAHFPSRSGGSPARGILEVRHEHPDDEEILVVVDFCSRDGNRFHVRATRKGRVAQQSLRLPESCSTQRRRADSAAVRPSPLVLAASARCRSILRMRKEESLAYGCE